ncbi:oligoendopeptidase F [Clostridia bacterium]|nr:oligoendopeptidase F [Clostridia bacterium]
MSEQKTRDQIDQKYKWKLEDICPTNEDWETRLERLKASMPELSAKVLAIGGSDKSDKQALRDAVLAALTAVERAGVDIDELYTYAKMRRDEDNRIALYQGMYQRAESLYVEIMTALAPLKPSLLSLDEADLESYITDAAFSHYDRDLRDIIAARPHTLSGEMEQLIAKAGEVFSAPSTAFDMLTDADFKFPTIKGENGEDVEVTHAKYGSLMESVDKRVRRDAFTAFHEAYKALGNTFAALYTGSVKGDVYAAKVHNYASAREAALKPNEIPLSVYDGLVEAVRQHLPAMAKLNTIRKQTLGLDEIHMYDQYVNTETSFDMKLEYPDGYKLVMDALKPLGVEYGHVLAEAFEKRWIDVYETQGKSSGAYSWGTYNSHPYVLLNYDNGAYDDMSTVAHEMGHSLHTYYTYKNQPPAKAQYSMFVAEVASTVNEILFSIFMQNKLTDVSAKRYLIGELLRGFRGTVFRQTLFAEFERESHAMAERGEPLTCESLSALYLRLNKEYFGEAVAVDDIVGAEWMRIPHFYRAFYVYQYATGYSAAVYLARRILREGQPAVDDYIKFLSAGGAVPPIDALKLAGIDMSRKESVDEALSWFDELVDEYGKLYSK